MIRSQGKALAKRCRTMGVQHFPGSAWLLISGLVRRIMRLIIRPLFAECGRNVSFNPFDQFSYSTIRIGCDVYIAPGACFSARKGIKIGSKVMFGPNVIIRGGNHNTTVLGRYMFDVHEKRDEDDQPIVIEDDVWVGAGAIILKGVTINRGAIIGAGAVVTHDVAPYSVVVGIPAKVIRLRWPVSQILEHEKMLYPVEKRFTEEELFRLEHNLTD